MLIFFTNSNKEIMRKNTLFFPHFPDGGDDDDDDDDDDVHPLV